MTLEPRRLAWVFSFLGAVSLLTAGCSNKTAERSSPQEGLRITGALEARFAPSESQKCSVSKGTDAKGNPIQSFVFNGANSTSPPGSVLFFSIFPYAGVRSYALSASSRSQVLVASTRDPSQQRYEGASGEIVVKTQSPTSVSGAMQVILGRGGSEQGAKVSGTWTCELSEL